MQLVAYGAQDIYLTGNPQITFFKVVYRRHTNFSTESIQQTFNGTVDFGNTVTATISRNGDLIHRCYLETQVTSGNADNNIGANLGSALIKEVSCEIGGQEIDKHYGHWLEAWAQLSEVNDAGTIGTYIVAAATTSQSGNATNGSTMFQKMSGMGGQIGLDMGSASAELKLDPMWIPLQFWFCRNPGLALPLIALQYHEVKIKVVFYGMSATDGPFFTAITGTNVLASNLWVDYIYLDTDERRRFAQVSHEYLIEQLQYQTTSSAAAASYTLNFNHPVKELIWTGGTTNTASVSAGVSTPTVAGASAAVNATPTTYQLKLNGHDRMAARDWRYFTRTQVHEHHSGCGGVNIVDSIAVYSFALKPEEHQPSGTCNFSRIDNAQIVIGGTTPTGSSGLNVYAVNYNVLRIMSGMGGLAYSN